jgi:hypothetical protein
MWVIYDTINNKMLVKSEVRFQLVNDPNYYNNPTTILVWVYGQDLSNVPFNKPIDNNNRIACRAPINATNDNPSINNKFKH